MAIIDLRSNPLTVTFPAALTLHSQISEIYVEHSRLISPFFTCEVYANGWTSHCGFMKPSPLTTLHVDVFSRRFHVNNVFVAPPMSSGSDLWPL